MTSRRTTIQRKVILEEVRSSRRHMTAAEVHAIVRQKLPQLSLGTVYRNLDLLTHDGLIRRLVTVGRETRFDGVVSAHYHLHCRRCGRIEDIRYPVAVRVEAEIPESSGWEIAEPSIEFPGICPDCRTGLPDQPDNRASGQ